MGNWGEGKGEGDDIGAAVEAGEPRRGMRWWCWCWCWCWRKGRLSRWGYRNRGKNDMLSNYLEEKEKGWIQSH